MPTAILKSGIFDTMEAALDLPTPTAVYEHELDVMVNGWSVGNPKVLQLSSSLIRVSQVLVDDSGAQPLRMTYETRLSGSGIGPVSTLNALVNAIDKGLATGNLSKVEILQANAVVLALTMDSAGYHLTSGDIVVSLDGTLPLSFAQLFDLADLFDKVGYIDSMTRPQRLALFNDLSAYAVSGLSLTDGGNELFGVHVAATTASLTLNGLTMTATGTFPDNLGEDVQVLWDLFKGMTSGLGASRGFDGLAITGLTMTDAAGTVLGRIANPLAATPDVIKLDGRIYDSIHAGDNSGEYLTGYARERLVLAGLGGDDMLAGGIKADHLLGGSGDDTMQGGRGADRIDGGAGRDVMTGGGGADVFHFDLGDGYDRITDFAQRVDVIEILDATRKSDLTFTVVGDDVQIDYHTIHILVEDITLAQLNQVANFHF